MGALNDLTVEKRDTIKNAGYNHVSTYKCQLTKSKDFQKFAKNFTQEIVEPLQSKECLLQWTYKCNQTPIQLQRKRMWPLHRLLLSVSHCSVLPKISNWSPYQNI